MLLPKIITKAQFDETMKQYPDLIKSISDSKSVSKTKKLTSDSKSLLQLDEFRFTGAREWYERETSSVDSEPGLGRAEVLQLVEWKLKHGTFRPTLMALCAANNEQQYREVTKSAFHTYEQESGATAKAIKELSTIKGIGPATASLLLSVHDPARVPFFSDEAFRWICCDGKNATIKYTAKEYEELARNSRELIDRLKVDAREVEKVAFVLMRKPDKLGVAETESQIETSKKVQKRKVKVLTVDSDIDSAGKRPKRE